MSVKLSASLMCADALQLGTQIADLEKAGMDLLHVDIMDGHFVSNLAMNFDMLSSISAFSAIPLDIHLMVDQPAQYLHFLKELNCGYCSFHIETTHAPIKLLREIKSFGGKAGLAFNPATSLDRLEWVAEELDFVLMMSVEPGFAGQQFISPVVRKVQQAKKLAPHAEIQVDGNINTETAKNCKNAGADILVCGTASIFLRDTPLVTACQQFRNAISHPTSR